MATKEAIERIRELYRRHGHNTYGEVMTQTQHAVQAARLAMAQDRPDEVVLSAFLHDIGHLLVNEVPIEERDDAVYRHQKVGADYLRQLGFSEKVATLVEHHVDGKRYLTAINPAYYEALSPASVESLTFQGGPMSHDEVVAFDRVAERDLYLDLRRWDDLAKDPDDPNMDIEPFLAIALRHLEQERSAPQPLAAISKWR